MDSGWEGKAGFSRDKNRAEHCCSMLHKSKYLLTLGKSKGEVGDSDVCAGCVLLALACRLQCCRRAQGGSVMGPHQSLAGPLPLAGFLLLGPRRRGRKEGCALRGLSEQAAFFHPRTQHPSAAPTQPPLGLSDLEIAPSSQPSRPGGGT